VNIGWLLDSSALAVAHRPEVLRLLRPLLTAGLLYTCPLLDLEALSTATSADAFRQMRTQRREAYRPAPLEPPVGERAVALQGQLARRAVGSRVEPRDLVVAATALEHDLTVLHHHPAFELLGGLCGLEQRAVVPLGAPA
jgi:predicted nucleic acid-binding protein